MPKIKTHSGAKKRFKVSKSGKIKRAHVGRRHILTKKNTPPQGRLCRQDKRSRSKAPATLRVISFYQRFKEANITWQELRAR